MTRSISRYTRREFIGLGGLALAGCAMPRSSGSERLNGERHLLYVASPGIRNYTEWGGVGILVYDIADDFRFVRRIATLPEVAGRTVENVKGICANVNTGLVYVSTPKRLFAIDLRTDTLRWNYEFEQGCDRMSITPDGSAIYLPSFERSIWYVLDGATGREITRIETGSGAHNTICGPSGATAYLAGLRSPLLRVVDTRTRKVAREVGPFGNYIRPFTVDSAEARCYVNVNDLLGFEVGDLRSGRVLHRVEVPGYQKGPVKRHGCPSHGVGLTPDESEVWLCDGANSRVHVFDVTASPPRLTHSIAVRDQPGWVTFTMDGRYAIPSTGEIVDARSKQIVQRLSDETGRAVQSEKVVEIVVAGTRPVRVGDQFGLGRRGRV